MKNLLNLNTNVRMLENLVRTMSKGYYSNFTEYNPDHSSPDEFNDHSEDDENSDHSYPDGIRKIIEIK